MATWLWRETEETGTGIATESRFTFLMKNRQTERANGGTARDTANEGDTPAACAVVKLRGPGFR